MTSVTMTQSRVDRKRASMMKTLETENTPKRDIEQDKDRGRNKDNTDRRGGV